jgi:hypothetical protein
MPLIFDKNHDDPLIFTSKMGRSTLQNSNVQTKLFYSLLNLFNFIVFQRVNVYEYTKVLAKMKIKRIYLFVLQRFIYLYFYYL